MYDFSSVFTQDRHVKCSQGHASFFADVINQYFKIWVRSNTAQFALSTTKFDIKDFFLTRTQIGKTTPNKQRLKNGIFLIEKMKKRIDV